MLTLRPSKLRRWAASIAAIGVCMAVAWSVAAIGYTLLLALTAAGVLAAGFYLMWVKAPAQPVQQVILADSALWIGPAEISPAIELTLPDLQHMRRYLGLVYLRNSAHQEALIWPDSISPDEHRRLRIWLGIHA
jgi:hypothetical protein